MYKVFKLSKEKGSKSALGYKWIIITSTRLRGFQKLPDIQINEYEHECYGVNEKGEVTFNYFTDHELYEEICAGIYNFDCEVSGLLEFKNAKGFKI